MMAKARRKNLPHKHLMKTSKQRRNLGKQEPRKHHKMHLRRKTHEHGMNDESDVGDSKVRSGSPSTSPSPLKVRNRGLEEVAEDGGLKKLRKMAVCKLWHVHGESGEDGPTESDEIQKGLGGGRTWSRWGWWEPKEIQNQRPKVWRPNPMWRIRRKRDDPPKTSRPRMQKRLRNKGQQRLAISSSPKRQPSKKDPGETLAAAAAASSP